MEDTYGISIPKSTVHHQSDRAWERDMVKARPNYCPLCHRDHPDRTPCN